VAPATAVRKEPKKQRTPRVDWAKLLRRTFALDVFTCAWCGGRRRVLAYLTAPNAVRAILEHLSLPTRPAQLAAAQGPPQLAWCCTSSSHAAPDAHAPAASPWGATWASVCPMGLYRVSTGPAHSPRGTRQQPSSTPRLQPSPSTRPPFRLYAPAGVGAGGRARRLHAIPARQLVEEGGAVKRNRGTVARDASRARGIWGGNGGSFG
jgi:hypothetical protein